jgi:hypothetical protein
MPESKSGSLSGLDSESDPDRALDRITGSVDYDYEQDYDCDVLRGHPIPQYRS